MDRRRRNRGISSSDAPRGQRFALPAILAACLALSLPARAQTPADPPYEEPPLPPPVVKAASAVLMDQITGTVLWEKNARVRRPNASTTKIVTALLAIESGRLDDTVAFSQKACATPYANLNARPGEKFRLRDLLYAMLLRSSNDACVAVAEHLAGSAWRYAARMTARARELGAADTQFVTTNGLYHPQHFSTAYDLALITRHAMENPLFSRIVATRVAVIPRTGNRKDVVLRNHNKFLMRYPGADGVKTGYVRQAGRCLVASATQPEQGLPWRLIAVVLNSPDTYGDCARMIDWGRRYFQPVFFARRGETAAMASVRAGARPSVPLVAARDLVAIARRHAGITMEREVRAPRVLPAPVEAAQVAGRLVALVDGVPAGEVELLAATPVRQVWTASAMPWTAGSALLAALLFVPRYARTFTKGARRRRYRLASRSRNPHRLREGDG